MRRSEVLSEILALFPAPTYLEIGVNQGETFTALTAARKIAVDPHFQFAARDQEVPGKIEHYEVSSDEYFERHVGRNETFNVVYLDGLHTYEQTLRDLLNVLPRMSPDGVIVIDDVLPSSYDASLPDLQQVFELRQRAPLANAHWFSDMSWMGDVFKLVFFIQSFLQQYSFATVVENHGQLVMWRQARRAETIPPRTMEEIARFDYRDTILRRDAFSLQPLATIVQAVIRSRA